MIIPSVLKDNVLLEKVERKPMKGSLLLVEPNKDDAWECIALRVGKDVKEINQGDILLVPPYRAKLLQFEDHTYFLMKEEDVFGKL